jgi:Amt family ammonium transporter
MCSRHRHWIIPAFCVALGCAGPLLADEAAAAAPTLQGVADSVAALDTKYAGATQFIWVLIAGFLVMFMQAGFAMVEAGFCRAKNSTNLMAKNLLDFVMGSLAFFVVGYAVMKGTDHFGLFGTGPLCLSGDMASADRQLDFFWQLVFCATAATIVSGAVAERLKFSTYLAYSLLVSLVIYPLYGHWVWGGGWLAQLGHMDFAGSGVVHSVGGWVALAGAIVLGPRFGKFSKDGKPRGIPGHSITLAALGTFILWFGWFGFNPGSTFSGTDNRTALIAVNTNMAAAMGALTALLLVFLKTKRWDVGMALNGCLAGLVAVTAPCAYITGWASLVIGLIAGILVVLGVFGFERLGIDDPVGAVSVHGLNGVWGLISLGLFADGTYGTRMDGSPIVGLFYGGNQLVPQLIGALTVMAWAFVLGFLMFKVLDKIMGIRVSAEEEIKGLDIPEHGTPAYPDFYTSRG